MLWTNVQRSFTGGRLDKELMGRQDLKGYFEGTSELVNFLVRRQGNLSKRRGTDLVADLTGYVAGNYAPRIIPLVQSKDLCYYILFTNGKAWIVGNGGVIGTSQSGVLTGITDEKLADMNYVQSGDSVILLHRGFAPKEIDFHPGATPYITISDISFTNSSQEAPTDVGADWTGSGSEGSGAKVIVRYAVSSIGSDGSESDLSAVVEKTYKLPWPDTYKFVVKWKTDPCADPPASFNVYKNTGSGFGLIGNVSSSSETTGGYYTFDDTYITPDMTVTPKDPDSKKTFSASGDYPSVGAFYQQRLVLGSTDNDPFTFWMSRVGDIYEFSTHTTIREDDAITATLAATEMPDIRHMLLGRELMAFTESGEWQISPVSGNTLSYKTVSAKMQSAIGTNKDVRPIMVGSEIVFADQSGERLLATSYNLETDGFDTTDLTVMSQWIFRNNPIKRMVYRRVPDSTIYCVLSDGTVATLVYMKDQNVCAWSRMTFVQAGGLIRDVITGKSSPRGCTDVAYLVFKGNHYEIWKEREDLPIGASNSASDLVCMDRCRMISSTEMAPGTGYAVGISSGRVYQPNEMVFEDCIAGDYIGSVVETVYPEVKGQDDSLQMEIKNATEAQIRVIDGSSYKVGALAASRSFDRTVEMPVTASGGVVTLPSKDARVVLTGANSRDGRVRIAHDGPWPLNILSVGITYQVEQANGNEGK